MSSFDSRKDDLVNRYLSEETEARVERLVANSQMQETETNFHRGYVAALKNFSLFYNKDLKIKLDSL